MVTDMLPMTWSLRRCFAPLGVGGERLQVGWLGGEARPGLNAGGRCLLGTAAAGWYGLALWLVAEQVAGLAAEGVAQRGEGGEADRAGAAVLEDRQVDHRDSDAVGQFGEGHAAMGQQPVQVDGDAVVSVLGGHR